MINLAVINLKTILKKILKIIIVILIVAVIIKFVQIIYHNIKKINFETIESMSGIEIIKNNISVAKYYKDNSKERESELKKILVAQLAVFTGAEEEIMEKENQEEILEFESLSEMTQEEKVSEEVKVKNEEQIENNEQIDADTKIVQTSVIESHNKKDVYTDIYKTVQIKNESDYSLTEEMITPNIKYRNNKDIIIYHTHTCESYTATENSNYVMTGNYRTTDLNYSVVRVGEELTNNLAGKGYTVIHDKTYHDYPAYTGSYTRSLATIQNLLSVYNTVDAIFDIHRDALGNNSDYAPCVQIGDEKVAQLMFVMGTNGGGLEHLNWNNNLKLAVKIQEKANEMYPGLFKPIILRNSRYNQHVTNGAAIIEVGATGNTIEQCNGSMKYLSNVIDEVMKQNI